MSVALARTGLIAPAAAPLTEIAAAVTRVPLGSPTPCTDWDVAGLLRHVRYWTPLLAAAGARRPPTPIAAAEGDVDLAGWQAAWVASLDELVDAWSDPAVWTGTVALGGPDPLPAPMIGGMVLGELVLHGWDLSVAAGIRPTWPDEVLIAALDAVAGMVEQGRGMGVFGPEVPVAADAPLLDRVVALSGRDPGWARVCLDQQEERHADRQDQRVHPAHPVRVRGTVEGRPGN